MLSESHIQRGYHIYTSGSTGTNSAVIKGAIRGMQGNQPGGNQPGQLTVILPQHFSKQDDESQVLLHKCRQHGGEVIEMAGQDELPLQVAADRCNTKLLDRVKKLVIFSTPESQ